jgi:cell division GTPase FtsZ
VDFICINTDAQALKASGQDRAADWQQHHQVDHVPTPRSDAGRGRRPRPHRLLITGCDMLFITAGMGGTGTGAAPVVQLARELDPHGRRGHAPVRDGRSKRG